MSEHQFQFSHDWASMHFPLWGKVILPHTESIKYILEIGCFEGRSSVWFLQNFPGALLTCIDTFEGDDDLKKCGVDFSSTESRWAHNVSPWKARTTLRIGQSNYWIPILGIVFDLILVDGDHSARGCLTDLILSWGSLNPGGIMIIDDYGWGNGRPELETPKPAVDAFLKIYAPEIEVLNKGYQVIIRRK